MYQSFNIKKLIAFVLATVIICSTFISAVMLSNKPEVFAADSQKVISLQIDNPNMTIDGQTSEIDSGFGTKPLIVDGHTLVPIRAIIESVGGSVEWNQDTKEVTLKYDNNVIRLVIDSTEAYLNDKTEKLDVAPAIINNRTMLPIRFISEGFGFNVAWDSDTKTIEITVTNTNVAAAKIIIKFWSFFGIFCSVFMFDKLFKSCGGSGVCVGNGGIWHVFVSAKLPA